MLAPPLKLLGGGLAPPAPPPLPTPMYFITTVIVTGVKHIISIFHGCMVWIEKSVTRVTDWHHEACRVMPNSDPE